MTNFLEMSHHGLPVEVFPVLLCHRLQRNDVADVHAAAQFQRRRRFADGQRSDVLNVDENLAWHHYKLTIVRQEREHFRVEGYSCKLRLYQSKLRWGWHKFKKIG